jgi:hypothetical protein
VESISESQTPLTYAEADADQLPRQRLAGVGALIVGVNTGVALVPALVLNAANWATSPGAMGLGFTVRLLVESLAAAVLAVAGGGLLGGHWPRVFRLALIRALLVVFAVHAFDLLREIIVMHERGRLAAYWLAQATTGFMAGIAVPLLTWFLLSAPGTPRALRGPSTM